MILSETYKTRIKELAGIPVELAEISLEQIRIPKKYIHKNLNLELWDNNGALKKDVKDRLFQISYEFIKYLKIEPSVIKNIVFTGSMANFNYNNKYYSDIDIHIILNFSEINADTDLVKLYLDAMRSMWNLNHNIKIYNHPVELYVQDVNEKHYSSGVYSIIDNKWLVKPKKEDVKIDRETIKEKSLHIINDIETIQEIQDPEKAYELAINLIDKLRNMRKSGLEHGGEFSVENLTYKYLRNTGQIKKLLKLKKTLYSKIMSL